MLLALPLVGCGQAPSSPSIYGTWAYANQAKTQTSTITLSSGNAFVQEEQDGQTSPVQTSGAFKVDGATITLDVATTKDDHTVNKMPLYLDANRMSLGFLSPEASHQGLVGTWSVNSEYSRQIKGTVTEQAKVTIKFVFAADNTLVASGTFLPAPVNGTWQLDQATGEVTLMLGAGGTFSQPHTSSLTLVDDQMLGVFYHRQ
jgi:hypothetical protein